MILWAFPGQPLQWEQSAPDDADFRAIADLCRERCGYDMITHQPSPEVCSAIIPACRSTVWPCRSTGPEGCSAKVPSP